MLGLLDKFITPHKLEVLTLLHEADKSLLAKDIPCGLATLMVLEGYGFVSSGDTATGLLKDSLWTLTERGSICQRKMTTHA